MGLVFAGGGKCRLLCFLPSPHHRSLPLFASGFLIGFLLNSLLFDGWEAVDEQQQQHIAGDVQKAEKWERTIVGGESLMNSNDPQQQQQPLKFIRARFAASELGIRRRILLLPLIRSPVGMSLHRWVLSAHFDSASVRPVVDTSRVDPADFVSESIPLRPGGLVPTHVQLLNAIANQTLQHNFDWFLLFPERTFLNPFQLRRLINSLRWNVPLALGHRRRDGGGGDLCAVEAGILLSNSAMRLLVEGRNLCRSIVARSEESALEKCILLATNLSCQTSSQGLNHFWWRVPEDQHTPNLLPLHDQIPRLATRWSRFNRSLTVSPLLSDLDVRALLEHFLSVEIDQMDAEIEHFEKEFSSEFGEDAGWPVGFVGGDQKVPNRFQAPVWELFDDAGNLFGNDPDRNVEGVEKKGLGEELKLVIEMAIKKAAAEQSGLAASTGGFEYGKVRQGYRRFDPEKGMEYVVDVEEHHRHGSAAAGQRRLVRVQLSRPFHSTTVLEKVPFVKEDSDITIVVPVESVDQALSLRSLLRRQLLLCSSLPLRPATRRQIRFVIAVRSIEAVLVRVLGANLAEMERKCKHSFNTDSALLLLQPADLNNNNNNKVPIEIVATDTAIDRYGQQTLFLLLSPFVDFQWDFLDRVRVNTIRHFQVFFPIPFAEFNPFVSGLSPAIPSAANTAAADFVIHKDRGRFDTEEFGVAALHGTDYAAIRAAAKFDANVAAPIGLFHLFHNTSAGRRQHGLHVMRAIDPSLRIRYRPRVCPTPQGGYDDHLQSADCETRRAQRMGTRAQLARLIFANN